MSAVPSPGSGYSKEEIVEWRHFSKQGLVPLHSWQSRHNYVIIRTDVVKNSVYLAVSESNDKNGVLGAVSGKDPEGVVVFFKGTSGLPV